MQSLQVKVCQAKRWYNYTIQETNKKTASPHYQRISWATVKADCWTSYEVEMKRLNELLKTVDKISITIDMWNATYAMLLCALEFKQVFSRYQQRDPNYKHLPSEDDWFKVEEVCSFLGLFNEVTKIISGNKCLIFHISIHFHFYFYFLQLCYTIQIFMHSNKFRF